MTTVRTVSAASMRRRWSSALVLGALVMPASVDLEPDIRHVMAMGALGGPEQSTVLVEGFDLDRVPGAEGDTLSVFVAFGPYECFHDASVTADVEVNRGLSRATATGSTAGTCSDGDENQTPVTATVDLRWKGTGPATRTTETVTEEGRTCTTIFRQRSGVLSGTVTWTAPDIGATETGTPSGEALLLAQRRICRPA
jgi:hypothetical protein